MFDRYKYDRLAPDMASRQYNISDSDIHMKNHKPFTWGFCVYIDTSVLSVLLTDVRFVRNTLINERVMRQSDSMQGVMLVKFTLDYRRLLIHFVNVS